MLKKASLPELSIPNLVIKFKQANERVYGCSSYIHEEEYGKFKVLEDDLRAAGIDYTEYADVVILGLKSVVKHNKLKCVPVNMFCGKYAWNMYHRLMEMETVDISRKVDVDVLLQDELTVARYYINQGREAKQLVLFRDAVKALRPMLSEQWLRCYYMSLERPVEAAVNVLRSEYRCKDAKTYLDFIRHGHI